METKYCEYCGTAMDADSLFCPACGAKQENADKQTAAQPQTAERDQSYSPAQAFAQGFAREYAQNAANYGTAPARMENAVPIIVEEKKKGIGGLIFSALITVGLLIGGFSGELVLRGTDSSTALIVVAFGFLIWDIVRFIAYAKAENPKGYSTANYMVVLKGATTAEVKKRAKAEKTNVNEYVVKALTTCFPAAKLEGLGVAYSLLGEVKIAFVSSSRSYLESELLPTFDAQIASYQFGTGVAIDGVSDYKTDMFRLGEIENGLLPGTGFVVSGVNAGLKR